MAIKVTGTTVINDSRNIENITTINGTDWAALVAQAAAGDAVTEAEVTAHEAALTITESQISDLGNYETADATILKNADIGVNVQSYDANIVSDATYVKTDENFTTADHTKLDGIEALADVTDTVNVTAAGALMDSEVTNLADVKAFDSTDYEPADTTILKDADIGVNVLAYDANVVSDANYVATANDFTTVLKDKLDAIEASATADQTGAEIKALYEAESDTNVFDDNAHDKLNAIEANATADQTKADIEGLGIELPAANLTGTIAAARLDTATTQAETDDSTKIATTAFVTDKIETLIGGAPGTLNDLNELAAAINDDANYNTTLTTALGTKLPKAGGTMSGDIDMGGNKVLFNNMYATEGDLPSATTYHGMFAHVHATGKGYFAHGGNWVELANASDAYSHPTHPGDDASVDTGALTGATVISDLDFNITTDTNGHVTDANATVATRDLTLANLGYTGATNANYITNNNQITNGAGYITSFTNTTYSAGSGLDLSGTTFSLESDARGDLFYMGRDTNDYIGVETTQINFVLDGNTDMRLENDGDLHVDGNVVAFSTTISDERLKKDIVKIDGALDKVSQLGGYTFEYLADGKKSAGVIAQEVEKVLPSAIVENKLPLKMGDEDETMYKTVQYDQLTGLLIEAIKELKAEIETLKG